MNRLLKFKELVKYVPLSRATLWRRVKAGTFPKPIDLGGGTKNSAKAWIENDILAWMEEQQSKPVFQNVGTEND